MLRGDSPWYLHFVQNACLIFLSLCFLPLDTFVLFGSYGLQVFAPQNRTRRRALRSVGFHPKTFLVTGVGMSKGLAIARLLYEAGHTVIGADFEPHGVPASGRFSRALQKFYTLSKPNEEDGAAYYIRDLLRAVRRERVDIWISCSGVASAVEDGQAKEVIERRSDCKAVQFDVKTTSTLHEKHSFIQHTLALGLTAPETYDVTTRAEVHKILHAAHAKHYIMKSVGVDDAARGDMTLLPRRTVNETYHHISRISISKDKPWVLQQYIQGEEYCTHAVVVRGEVKAFVACPSLELLMHYEALPVSSSLSRAMLKFTQEFAVRSGPITGHLSFDFLVGEKSTEKGVEKVLYPIECNPRAHTAVVLFSGRGLDMSKAYLTVLAHDTNGTTLKGPVAPPVEPNRPTNFYWIGHDLVTLIVYPAILVLTMQSSMSDFVSSCYTFFHHLLFWKDGTFETWDPLPWWCLYHIYWPGQFLACILQRRKWSRINVSTTKMFEC